MYVYMLSYSDKICVLIPFLLIAKISEFVFPAPEREIAVETAPMEFVSGMG